MNKLIYGGLAGIVATTAMTAAMRRLHPLLDEAAQYELPPREIIDRTSRHDSEDAARDCATLAHFAYGALAGATFAAMPQRQQNGAVFGIGVWLASYFGWIPAMRILPPAHEHPTDRNALMIAAHLVWGVTLSSSLSEIIKSRNSVFKKPGTTSSR